VNNFVKLPVILITGKNGQVGWELQRSLMSLGHVVAVDRQRMDLSNNQSIIDCIRDVKPDIIVNTAAYTAVDKAEEEKELAMQVNGIAPGVIAEEAKKLGSLLIHYSTDYVFDGTKETPYVETDEPNPINEYGRTKLAGERAIQLSGCKYLIFRISWVYGARGNNFLLTMFRLMMERDELNVINDQVGVPCWSRLVSDVLMLCIYRLLEDLEGMEEVGELFHLCPYGSTSWFGFSQYIQKYLEDHQYTSSDSVKIKSITTEEYGGEVSRPKHSVLDTSKLCDQFGVKFPYWEAGVDLCLSDIFSKLNVNEKIGK